MQNIITPQDSQLLDALSLQVKQKLFTDTRIAKEMFLKFISISQQNNCLTQETQDYWSNNAIASETLEMFFMTDENIK